MITMSRKKIALHALEECHRETEEELQTQIINSFQNRLNECTKYKKNCRLLRSFKKNRKAKKLKTYNYRTHQ